MNYLIILFIFFFSSCSHTDIRVLSNTKIVSPKVIAIDAGGRQPWLIEIESRFTKNGFKVLRWTSQNQKISKISAKNNIKYNEASTRYILQIDSKVPLNWAHRCFGGGYKFDYITAEVIDTRTNETLAVISDQGYTENCAPMSGKIFSNIVNTTVGLWSRK